MSMSISIMDEIKLGKRKYNRSRHAASVWIFGRVERTEQKRMFVVHVRNKTAKTLLRLIKKYVKPGSIVMTDMFSSYIKKELGLEHLTVNHSKSFKNPIIKTHTNTIEGNWNRLKLMLQPRSRIKGKIKESMIEFVWRKIHRDCLWIFFLMCLKTVAYLNENLIFRVFKTLKKSISYTTILSLLFEWDFLGILYHNMNFFNFPFK
jgi:transposase-like protein